MRKPSASSMAEAITAETGITPASPAPLMPSGFSGDGVSRWSVSIARHLRGVRHQEVHERGVEQLPVLVVDQPLVQRAADALGDSAVDLPLDDHRVDQPCRSRAPPRTGGCVISAVSGSVSTIAACMPEANVDRDRRVVVLALQPRLLALGHRRPVRDGGAGELGRALGLLVEGVPQRVGQHRDRGQRDRRRRRALHAHHARR